MKRKKKNNFLKIIKVMMLIYKISKYINASKRKKRKLMKKILKEK